MNQEERRIVLLGKTGAGKSATGNTILGRNAFRSERSTDSVTEHSELVETRVGEKFIRVVDTPGFFDTTLTRDELAEELCRSVYLSQPGVHAFILVFKYDRITEQEEKMIGRLQKVFSEQVTDHMIILFTHAEGVRVEEINRSRNEHLRRVLDQCGGRFHIFNNAEPQNRQQVTELLQKIDRMVQQNGGGNQIFTNAELNNTQQVAKPLLRTDRMVQRDERGNQIFSKAEANNRPIYITVHIPEHIIVYCNGGFFTNEMFRKAQSSPWEQLWEKHRSMFYIGADNLLTAVEKMLGM